MDYTVLINKENKLDNYYIPQDLIATDDNENNFHHFIDPSLKPMISKSILPYFIELQKAAKEEGFNIIVGSGYRSYDYQKQVWDYNLNKIGFEGTIKKVAPPGASEHQTGLAFDVAYIIDSNIECKINEQQEETKWLFENSYKFGFILRYPKGKEEITGYIYEPWHYRFVGKELASKLFFEEITLEEYYMNFQITI